MPNECGPEQAIRELNEAVAPGMLPHSYVAPEAGMSLAN